MTRRSSSRTSKPAKSDLEVTSEIDKVEASESAKSDLEVTPEIDEAEAPKSTSDKKSEPANLEVFPEEVKPTSAPEKPSAEKVQAEIRAKLSKKSVEEDAFVPTTSAALDQAAKEIAKQQGFEFNRGTAIGARLMARAQQRGY